MLQHNDRGYWGASRSGETSIQGVMFWISVIRRGLEMVRGSIPTGDVVTGLHSRLHEEMSLVVQQNWHVSTSGIVVASDLKIGFENKLCKGIANETHLMCNFC